MRSLDKPAANDDRSLLRILAQPIALIVALVGVGLYGIHRSTSRSSPPQIQATKTAIAPIPVKPDEPEVDEQPEPSPPTKPAPVLDTMAVARAEEALQEAKIERSRAEGRLAGAANRLEKAQVEAAAAASAARAYVATVKNPSVRISQVNSRKDALVAEKKTLEKEVAAIEGTPRPGRKNLIDKSPVARPAEGKEFHFEVRRDRVAFIDLDRLTDKIKSDVRLQARQLLAGKPVGGLVGPVGDFSMKYEVGVEMPDTVDQLLESRGGFSYQLRGWELVADRDRRGETYEATRHPASEYSRAIRRLSPTKATITMWVYPDGYTLYRKLRDELHDQGFLVAARPLPEGVAIQGSPGGSKSAGQ